MEQTNEGVPGLQLSELQRVKLELLTLKINNINESICKPLLDEVRVKINTELANNKEFLRLEEERNTLVDQITKELVVPEGSRVSSIAVDTGVVTLE
jgi:predicted type IV restriction endonuclease